MVITDASTGGASTILSEVFPIVLAITTPSGVGTDPPNPPAVAALCPVVTRPSVDVETISVLWRSIPLVVSPLSGRLSLRKDDWQAK